MALHHRVLPPHAGVDQPLEPLSDPSSPAYLLDEPQAWMTDGSQPRRAGVSAFGFGGTNFHAVLEEYRDEINVSPSGANVWPCELVVLVAEDVKGLFARLRRLRAELSRERPIRLRDLAYTCALESQSTHEASQRLAMIAETPGRLLELIERLLDHLERGGTDLPKGVHLGGPERERDGKIAFLFPGQGTATPGICRDAALYLSELRTAMSHAADLLKGELPVPISRLTWPSVSLTGEERQLQQREVEQTHVAQPLIGALSCGWLDLAFRLGLRPACTAGHSFGEITALHAAGAFDRRTFLDLAAARGRIMASTPGRGGMAAVRLSREELTHRLAGLDGLVIANYNAPRQCTVAGPEDLLETFVSQLKADGVSVAKLAVSAAFHSPQMRQARESWSAILETVEIRPLCLPVLSADGELYPDDPTEIRRRLITQLEAPVDFAAQIRTLHKSGTRRFLELGPGAILTGLVRQTLAGEPHSAHALDGMSFRGFLTALASLVSEGVALNLPALFQGREVRRIDLDRMEDRPRTEWLIDGGRVRKRDEARGLVGTQPLVTAEAAALAADSQPPGVGRVPASSLAHGQAEDALMAYREYQQTMRQFLSSQEQVVSIFLERLGAATDTAAVLFEPSGFADVTTRLVSRKDGHQREIPRPHPDTVAVEELAWTDRETTTRFLLQLVSEQTGYHLEVLGINQDIESELGIDSLKRIEILNEFQKRLPAGVADRLRGQMDSLTRVRSLGAIIDAVIRELEPTMAGGSGTEVNHVGHPPAGVRASSGRFEAARTGQAHDDDSSNCPRFVMRAFEKPLPTTTPSLPTGLILVTEDCLGVAPLFVESLRSRGLVTHLMPLSSLVNAGLIAAQLAEARSAHGRVRALVHLASLSQPRDAMDLEEWHLEVRKQTKSLFHLIQQLAPDLAERDSFPGAVLAATSLGGAWGRDGSPGSNVASGGVHGLLRTLEAEFPSICGKTVDFDPWLAPGEMVDHLLGELGSIGDETEVGYSGGRRTVFIPKHVPIESDRKTARDWKPEPGWVVLVTGGSRGITAELAHEVARPGVRLIIVGRSSAVEAAAGELAAYAEMDAMELRRVLTESALARGETSTPARIEAVIQDELRRRRRAKNLDDYRQLGAEVEYHALDVRDAEAFGGLIEGLYERYGRIDAIIHGAGIVEDRRLLDKSPESFDRVFDTKVDSAFIMSRHLRPEALKWVALLSSVSGRFGNRGQVDYAAANETLNRLAWSMAKTWPGVRVVSVNYGPWRSEGMANEVVLQQLAKQGISPLEPAEGRRFLIEELAYGTLEDVEVVAGQGPWSVDESPMLSSVLEVGLMLLNIQMIASGNGGIRT